jgi:uncharacterized protein (DUF433 family)
MAIVTTGSWSQHIVIDPSIQAGAPVIRATRVPVAVIVEAVAAGDDVPAVARAYRVTEEEVRAALAYAAEVVRSERAVALPR